ncbi:transmembrane protein 11-A, mitochondrial-like [Saccoglossus kowalevskii]|uniref:Transmembrane protein 11-A, mitochondrial-like n=1 Tax=Saccoglossus kowalevskii TaxID=10224 RepID=A0ABM0GL77_SACKO|nr:PREDICTED: transmembrane protein 11-A, mitochondrial-like [Saccoglossus kowalevskii]
MAVRVSDLPSPSECAIIREVYDGENAQEHFEFQLEHALEAECGIIVIEPSKIGDETARWITVGNCLHKTAVITGVTCIVCPLMLPCSVSNYVSLPLGIISIGCASLYGVSWQFDPCCKYQVEYNTKKLSRLPLHTLTSTSPVVLVRRNDNYRKRLHNTISFLAATYCCFKLYRWWAQ